ncbi:MAG TPA: NADH-quinone oxidoreductase subunit H [Planctomycetota bacterium]|nr:NADH-quinone oxidoreductase subunit H [Planctomycetota bacterium]
MRADGAWIHPALLACAALAAAAAGLLAAWFERAVAARLQGRRGPPLLQPLRDIRKLLGKETLVPEGANRLVFALAPLAALAAASLAAAVLLATVLWQNGLLPSHLGLSAHGPAGDLIVVAALLAVPPMALAAGASASNNPFASLGAGRAVRLTVAAELPMLLALTAALVAASSAERRRAAELERQIDARTVPGSPLRSGPGSVGVLAPAVPLRLDRMLELRGAGPESPARYLGRSAAAAASERLTARHAAFQAERERNAQRMARLADNQRPAAVDRVQEELARARAWDAELERRLLALDYERSRLWLGAIQEASARDPGLPRDLYAADQRHLRSLVRGHWATMQLWELAGKDAPQGMICKPDGALSFDGAALGRATEASGTVRLFELLAMGLAAAAALAWALVRLGSAPFDCAEAGSELAGGVFAEYGGPLLAAWRLCRAMLLVVLPVFVAIVFLGGFRCVPPGASGLAIAGEAALSAARFGGVLLALALVRALSPRARVDQALRMLLGPVTLAAVLALAAALAARFALPGGTV